LFNLSFDFALGIIAFCRLLSQQHEYELSKQLFKSGTSIHAHVREAQHPESRADFVHKLKVGLKEGSETEGWLMMCLYAPGFPDPSHLLEKLPDILNLLSRSILTAKSNSTR